MHRLILLSLLVTACSTKAHAPAAAEGDEVARLVLGDLASPAFGNQKIEARCVVVSKPVAAGASTVVAAHVEPGCIDKSLADLTWIYVRTGSGAWNEQYLGSAPKCWKGVPPDIAAAVAAASGIPNC